jgi:probable F420-dependent oxidoreductase
VSCETSEEAVVRIGTNLPLGNLDDPGLVRETAQALEEAGFAFVTTSGHVLTAEEGRYPERPTPTYAESFRDPFVLFGFVAAVTRSLCFRTSVLILPLYPTALVARQAADLARLSGGRFELGVGISWQRAEFEALGQPFTGRAERMEEQIGFLRDFWSMPMVEHRGRFHQVDRLGLLELPPPIPVLIGSGASDRLLERVARLADGWLPLGGLSDPEPVRRLRELLGQAQRDVERFSVTGRLSAVGEDESAWVEQAALQGAAGATDLLIAPPPNVDHPTALAAVLAAKAVVDSL